MTFDDVGALVGGLPESARVHRVWWSNDSKSEALAWRAAGWHVEMVNLGSGHVSFARGAVGGSYAARSRPTFTRDSATRQQMPAEGRPEAVVQAELIAHLQATGWTILRQANTASKEQGIDVVAVKDGTTVACEVKGYPSRSYVDPRRAAEVKPTSPSVQARHWFAGAILASMLTRNDHPDYRVVIVVPDAGTYQALYARTRDGLLLAGVEVWFVAKDGSVVHPSGP
jgi:Holliday junction resolvase-like predicted endonuclease